MRFLLHWLLSASALLAITHLYSGVQVDSFTSALLAAALIGFFNLFVRPLLILLTLPVTLVTAGLFLFVINALMFWMASGLMSSFQVDGFWAALLGSLLYSVLNLLIARALGQLKVR